MKKLWIGCLSVVLLLGCLWSGVWTASAAGSMTASASASSVTVGQPVTVTLNYSGGGAPIGSLDVRVSYDAKVLQYVSCSGATANGGSGVVLLSWYCIDVNAPASVRFTLTFKALAAGNSAVTVSTEEFIDDNSGASLGAPGKSLTVAVNDPTASSNANLKSLKPSSGTLTPKFSANTTNYTITVPYTTTSLYLSAVTADKDAKVSGGGSITLAVGKNTHVVTVTAPSGYPKKYTVVITRAADQSTSDNSSGTTTTTVPPAGDPLEVTVEGETMRVSDTQPEAALPAGYSWESVDFGGTTVTAAKHGTNGTTLLWLTPAAGGDGAFYLYDAASGQFAAFHPWTLDSRLYLLLSMPAGQEAPAGTVAGKCTVGELEADAFLYEDAALADFAILYVTAPEGRTGLYVYDRTDGSLQRYHTVAAPVSAPVDDTPQTGVWQTVLNYGRTHWKILLAVGLAMAVLVIVVIVAAVRRSRTVRNSRH